jgi:hypothetical protein
MNPPVEDFEVLLPSLATENDATHRGNASASTLTTMNLPGLRLVILQNSPTDMDLIPDQAYLWTLRYGFDGQSTP